MKKILALMVVIWATGCVFAQNEGKKGVGIELRSNLSKNEVNDVEDVIQNDMDLTLGYTWFKSEKNRFNVFVHYYSDNNARTNERDFSCYLGLDYFRYKEIGNNFYWTPGIGLSYGTNTYKDNSDMNGVSCLAHVDFMAFEYRLNNHFGFTAKCMSFMYDYQNCKSSESENANYMANKYNIGLMLAPSVGLIYYIK